MCFGEKLYCNRRRLSPAHSSKVLAFEGSCFTTPKVCCTLMESENQKRPRSSGPEKVNRGYQSQDGRAGVRVSRANPPGLDFGGPRGIHVETRGQRAVDGVPNLKSIQQILRLS